MERTKMTLKDLAVSFHFPKFSTSRDFYKAFGCRVCMLLSYQMISVYQLYIVEDYVHQTKTEAAGTIATMSIITMVVSLTASLISGPISDKMHTHKVPVIIASLLFAIGTAMPWIMPSVTGMYLYAGIAGFGYGVRRAVELAAQVGVLILTGGPGTGKTTAVRGIVALFRKLGQYGVSIYETEFKALADAGDILPVDSGKGEELWVLANTSLYDERTGLSLNPEYGKGDFV